MDNGLISFVEYIIENKKLQFPITEIDLDSFLVENKIVKIENSKVIISDFEIISRHFVQKYKQKLKFSISKDFVKNLEFISNIENDFNRRVFSEDYFELEKQIWKSVIKESNIIHQCPFSDYLTSIKSDNKPESIYYFAEAYGSLLPELNLTEDEIIQNFFILAEITKNEGENSVDLGFVLNGIKELSKSNYKVGHKLLRKSLKLEERNNQLISYIITGLYEKSRLKFFEGILENLLKIDDNRNPICFGLSNVSDITEADCNLFIKLIKQFGNDKTLSISILALVFALLRSRHTVHHQYCFEELELAIESEISAYYILSNIMYVENYKREKVDVILKLISQGYFSIDKYIQPIARAVRRLKEFDFVKEVILSIIYARPFLHFIRKSKIILSNIDKTSIDIFMIELLTDNTASKRFIGLEIFQEMSHHNPFRFSYNILDLPPISQYKLWVALTVDFHQPKDRLISLLPLLDSESELVKESFICKLEELTEDYSGYVLEVLESNLDSKTTSQNRIIERIKNYIDNFHNQYTVAKNSVSEINPYNTHYEYIQKYNHLFRKKISKAINNGAMEESFLSMIGTNTVQLSKGGGYRLGPKKEIAQLSSFGSSLIMPRSYFINPNLYELNKGVEIKRNWNDDEYAEILKIIENE